jgi:hypothetical protein
MYLQKNKTPDSHSQQWEKQDGVEVRVAYPKTQQMGKLDGVEKVARA